VLLPPPPPLHPVPVCRESCFVYVYVCMSYDTALRRMCVRTYVTLEPLSMMIDGYSGLDGSGGPRRRLVTDLSFFQARF